MLPLLLLLQVAANSELGFRMTLPDDFVRITELIPLPGKDIVDCWGSETSRGGNLILCVQRMHAVLGRERLTPADLPPHAQLLTVRWQGFEIDAIRTDTAVSGAPLVIYTARVPLRREAIEVTVTAPRDASQEAHAALTNVLGSLNGESNWLPSGQRAGRKGSIVGWIFGIAIAVVVVRMLMIRRRTRATNVSP